MTRQELNQYIDYCILMGNLVNDKDEIYKRLGCDYMSLRHKSLIGSIKVDGSFYFKRDSHNKIHLVCYEGDYKEVNLGDCVDIIDNFACYTTYREKRHKNPLISIAGATVEEIGNFAFMGIPLECIDFPKVRKIGGNSFKSTNIEEAELNNLEEIPMLAFEKSPIKSFRGDKVFYVSQSAFKGCRNLETLILPKLSKAVIDDLLHNTTDF